MQRRTEGRLRRAVGNAKSLVLSFAAIAAVVGAFVERDRAVKLVDDARSRVSRLMLLEQVQWEEVGTTNLSHKITKDSLFAASGLKLGQELLPLDLGELEKKLGAIPWIESLQLQKKLPSTLYVRYTTHHARALTLRKGKIWSLTATGRLIAPMVAESALDLPVLTREDSVGPSLEWLEALEATLGSELVQVHEIDGSIEKAKFTMLLELQYSSRTAKVSVVGGAKPTEEALFRLKRVAQYLIKNNVLVSTIDLRMGKKVVVNVGRRP